MRLGVTASLAAVFALATAASAASAPGSVFEAAVVAGGSANADSFLKINVATGQTWAHCCSAANTSFTAVTEAGPLPQGDYHLFVWSTADPSGHTSWEAYRLDARTGHAWLLNCQPTPTCSWAAMAP